jgi:dipeptidyl aminopeptidase/acylaminoacyl peptidase
LAGASAPSWSPDGTRLVFATLSRLYIVRPSTWDVMTLTGDLGHVWRPTFSPDGRTILFTRASSGPLDGDLSTRLDLWTVPSSGGRASLLLRLDNRQDHAAFGAYGPDGTIAFRRTNYDGTTPTAMTKDVVWLADASGQNQRVLGTWQMSMSQVDPNALWPAWSPDGTRIAYESAYGRGIRIVDVRTGRIERLGRGIDPTWLDNDHLIVEAYGRGRSW